MPEDPLADDTATERTDDPRRSGESESVRGDGAGQEPRRDLIAHRGFAALHPENTLPALRRAAAHPRTSGVECDLRRCGSGEVVVRHDAVLDRVTDGKGRVADHSREELAALSVVGSDAGVPTLGEVVAAVPADVTLHLELKEPDLGADVVAAVADRDGGVVVSSFDPDAVAAVEAAGEVPTALLFADDPDRNLDRARELGCSLVHPHAGLCLDDDGSESSGEEGTGASSRGDDRGGESSRVDDRSLIARAHEAGLGVNAWTLAPPGIDRRSPAGEGVVADPDAPGRLRRAGVDGLIADAPV